MSDEQTNSVPSPPTEAQARLIERQVEDALRQHDEVADCSVVYAGAASAAGRNCVRCGIPDSYPGIGFDAGGTCDLCAMYDAHAGEIHSYFGDLSGFVRLLKQRAAAAGSDYDCMLLFSGGKDSSYVLYRLVDLGLRVMTFTFDNGFISKTALRNVEEITSELGIEHVTKTRADQRKVFLESLQQHKSVCNGCFRSLLDLSTALAHERGIPSIVTGLSRGQIIDERLSWFYQQGIFDPAVIEPKLALGRKIYHGESATIAASAVDAVEVVDFYRYCDVEKDGIRELLRARSDIWSQPADTGFCSSNCMINDVGVYVHNTERGYHNYEAPTRWEVRLGHLARAEADAELREPVNLARVKRMLAKVGYPDPAGSARFGDRLTAYVVPRDGRDPEWLRAALAGVLPEFLIPATWVGVEEIPREAGRVVRERLSPPRSRRLAGTTDDAGREPSVPLTPAQESIMSGDVGGASTALLLEVSGSVDPATMKRVALQLLLTHDALRLRFHAADGADRAGRADGPGTGWRQFDGGVPHPLPVSVLDVSDRPADAARITDKAVARLRSRLDVAEGPLVRFAVIDRGEASAHLLLVVHDLVADARALRLVLADLGTALELARSGRSITLPATGSFLDVAAGRAGETDRVVGAFGAPPMPDDELIADHPDPRIRVLDRWSSAGAATPAHPSGSGA